MDLGRNDLGSAAVMASAGPAPATTRASVLAADEIDPPRDSISAPGMVKSQEDWQREKIPKWREREITAWGYDLV